jgi:hypothetical protein
MVSISKAGHTGVGEELLVLGLCREERGVAAAVVWRIQQSDDDDDTSPRHHANPRGVTVFAGCYSFHPSSPVPVQTACNNNRGASKFNKIEQKK